MPEADADDEGATERLKDRVAELVTTTLDVGASMARSVAAATSRQPLPERGTAPLDDILTFGTTAAGNLVGLVVDTVRSAPRRAGAAAGAPAAATSRSGPRISAGSTLRVPLLVENTGAAPTTELSFQATAILRQDGSEASGAGLDPERISFSPATLVIAAKDFEKLTVRIPTSEATEVGTYRAHISGGDGWFTTVIDFVVGPASAA